MKCKSGLLAVIILASCLGSIVSAGCESCNVKYLPWGYKSGPPDYSKNAYWGMSAEDISGSAENSRSNPDSMKTKYDTMPVLVLPTSSSDRFSNLPKIPSKKIDPVTNFFGEKSSEKSYPGINSAYGSLVTPGRKRIM
jgi:hypothetical protein